MSKITLGHTRHGKALSLDTSKLTKHTVVLGASGSGKSGAIIGMCEQLIAQGTPIIFVDIKGDLPNIFLQDASVRKKMNIRLLTPGATHGEPINLFANLQRPERVSAAVSQLLRMCGEKNVEPLSSKPHAYLSMLLKYLHDRGEAADMVSLVEGLLEPPFNTMGAMPLEDHFSGKQRSALASKLNNLIVAPSFEAWRQGSDLDVSNLFALRTDGKTNVTVFSVSHLDDDQRMFAMALLFRAIVSWMREQRGTNQLRAALVVDECAGILPPHPKNPPTKQPIMTMFKQARAYGLGLIVSSQNPYDLDYKSLSNCETWIVGRLQMARDRVRVLEALAATTPHDKNRLEARIGGLDHRDFVLCRPKSTADFISVDVKAQLVGPMTPNEMKDAVYNYTPDLVDDLLSKMDTN